MPIQTHRFDSREALIDALFKLIVDDLERSLQQKDGASLLLSGGSTPTPLYRRLATADLQWDKVQLALIDERWVSTDHAASNEKLVRDSLIQDKAANAHLTGMKNAARSAAEGLADCNNSYAKLPGPYTLGLLGMGNDGHTASLFPQATGLEQAIASTQYCAAIRARRSEVTGDYLDRMTMTPNAILQSERLILLITGEDKWSKLKAVENIEDTTLAPVSIFTQSSKLLEVYWAP